MDEIHTYTCSKFPEPASAPPDQDRVDGTVSRSTFFYLFSQSCKMAGECGVPLSLILLDARQLERSRQKQLLELLSSECDAAEAVWQESEGVFLLLPFGYSRKLSESNLDQVREHLNALLKRTGLAVTPEIRTFSVHAKSDAVKLLQDFIGELSSGKEGGK